VPSKPLVIIPARVGSKGISGKNFRPLAGRSPFKRALDCVRELDAEVIISTDSANLFHHVGQRLYAPAPLHTDDCSMVDVVLDVLRRVPGPPDQVVLLVQPTQPLRRPAHLRRALRWFEHDCVSMASVVRVEPAQKLYYADFEPVTVAPLEQRQAAKPTFACDGTVYGFRRGWFLEWGEFRLEGETRMMEVSAGESCRLDTETDWAIAELRVAAADRGRVEQRDPVQLQLPFGVERLL